MLIGAVVGFILGDLFGIGLMCILQINRENYFDKNEEE